MADFGWSYPPGCSGPPEEPDLPPEAERVWEILERAEVDEEIIEQVNSIVIDLVVRADKECPQCLERWAQEEQRQWEECDDS